MKRKKPFPAQNIRAPSGEEMVILTKRDYGALVSIVQKGGKGLGAIPSTIGGRDLPIFRTRPVPGLSSTTSSAPTYSTASSISRSDQ